MRAVQDFERLYRRSADPWDFATSAYEQRRYDVTVACLPQPRYRRAFEPGCSVGELTRRLVGRCDEVVAWDAAPSAVAEAGRRLVDLADRVDLAVGVVPGEWPTGSFDLVVLSEVGYYDDLAGLDRLAQRAIGSLDDGGTLIAVHWLGQSDDHVLHGDDVHEALSARRDVDHLGAFRDDGFRADWWRRP